MGEKRRVNVGLQLTFIFSGNELKVQVSSFPRFTQPTRRHINEREQLQVINYKYEGTDDRCRSALPCWIFASNGQYSSQPPCKESTFWVCTRVRAECHSALRSRHPWNITLCRGGVWYSHTKMCRRGSGCYKSNGQRINYIKSEKKNVHSKFKKKKVQLFTSTPSPSLFSFWR